MLEQIKTLEKKKKDADDQFGAIKLRFRASYERIKQREEEIENLEENMKTMSQTIENQRKDLKEKEKEIEELKKGKDGNDTQKNTEEYQKDLAMGNKENERLNSLLEEQKIKNKELEIIINKLNQEKNLVKNKEDSSKIKQNIYSQISKTPAQTNKNFDPVIKEPKITEFDTQGKVRTFSLKDIFNTQIKNKLHIKKSENENIPEVQENNINNSFGTQKVNQETSEISYDSLNKSAKQKDLNQDQILAERKKNMTINITNYNITNINMKVVSPASKSKAEKNDKKPFSPIRTSKSLESNIISPKNQDFKSKLSSSFSIKSVDDKSEKNSNKLEFQKNPSKKIFGIPIMIIPSDMSDSDSSITSCILKSPKNSNGNNVFVEKKRKSSIVEKNEELNLLKDPKLVEKNELGSTGNMILPNLRNSIKSVNEDIDSLKPKKMTKSLFGNQLNNDYNEDDENIETLANGKTSFNFEDDQKDSKFSDSFEEDLFGNKKEMDSGVFSRRENVNVFEEDEVINQMMQEEVEVGETAQMFSQRYVAKTQEGANKNNNNLNKKPKKKIGKPLKKEEMTPEEKNVFDESFRNDSFAFASNNKEQSLLLVQQKGQVLNTNLSFAADKNTFSSITSFGTNQEIGNVLDTIVEDSNRRENKKKHKIIDKPKLSDLKIVPEEDIEKDFEFNLPMKMEQNNTDILQFDSKGMGDFFHKSKEVNEKSEGKDLHQMMKDFNTGNMDQKIFDNVLKHKQLKEIELDGSLNSPLPSPNGSTDGMFFETKRLKDHSEEDLEKDQKIF